MNPNHSTVRFVPVLAALFLGGLWLFAACSSEDAAPAPSGPIPVSPSGPGSNTTDASAAGSGGSSPGSGGSSGTGGTEQSDAAQDITTCEYDGGCYPCAPSTMDQWLNACTTASCIPFDNKARLPLLQQNGTLPPLP